MENLPVGNDLHDLVRFQFSLQWQVLHLVCQLLEQAIHVQQLFLLITGNSGQSRLQHTGQGSTKSKVATLNTLKQMTTVTESIWTCIQSHIGLLDNCIQLIMDIDDWIQYSDKKIATLRILNIHVEDYCGETPKHHLPQWNNKSFQHCLWLVKINICIHFIERQRVT